MQPTSQTMARDSSYLCSYNGNAMVEDFPTRHCVRQDYGKNRSTMSRHTYVTGSDTELWKKCSVLLKSHKKLTKLFVIDTCIHVIVLIFVTITTANLASEKHNFRDFWIDLQKGYFSLLLKDYSPEVFADQKFVYSSWLQLVSSQEEVMGHLSYAFQRFENVDDVSLARITKRRYNNGTVIYPELCIDKRAPINLHEEYKVKVNKHCAHVKNDSDIVNTLNSSLHSALLVSMDFQFEEIYLVEGHKPVCIQVEARYYMENDHQRYLWPVKIFVKGSLTNCDVTAEDRHFLPVNNIGFFVTAAVITVGVCLVGFVFHSMRLLTFLKVGKLVRNYANEKKLSKPLWCCFPEKIQQYVCWKSPDEIEKYARMHPRIPLKAYVIFCPPIHILDTLFLVLAIVGVILQFTLLRISSNTDELIRNSTSVSFVFGLCSIYFWCTSFRLLNHSRLAGVTMRSLVNSKATRSILAALTIATFAYIGVVLFAWVLLGIFHPYFSTFRLSAESFYSLLFGDEVITIFDGIVSEQPQQFIFVMSRVVIAIYGMLFPILLLSVIIAIVSVAAEQKYLPKPKESPSHTKEYLDSDGILMLNIWYNWRVLLEWATAPYASPFPGADLVQQDEESVINADDQDNTSLPSVTQQVAQRNLPMRHTSSGAQLTTNEQANPVTSSNRHIPVLREHSSSDSSGTTATDVPNNDNTLRYSYQGIQITNPMTTNPMRHHRKINGFSHSNGRYWPSKHLGQQMTVAISSSYSADETEV